MKFAIIENGIVTNVILTSQEFVDENNISGVFSDTAGIGDTYANGVFTKPNAEESFEFVPVRPMYMRLALMEAGILETIESAIAQPGNEVSRIAFEYALEFNRNDPLIQGFSQALGLSSEIVDNIFKRGMALQSSG